MKHVVLPDIAGRKLPFYLALEEWIASRLPVGEYFFAWQVAPTVICGRCQDVALEVDLDFCRRRGIEVYRRRSGGGAVYADGSNIMFSYVGPQRAVADAFSGYTSRVAGALRSLGIPACASGRNDIVASGRKIAGNACRSCCGRTIVHGTMLYDCDEAAMAGALTPSRAKLLSHKVASVASRVTTVREFRPDLSQEAFLAHVISSICDEEAFALPDDAFPEIEALAEPYFGEVFGPAQVSAFNVHAPDVGHLSVSLELDGRYIRQVKLIGDFFEATDVAEAMASLAGIALSPHSVAAALGDQPVIAGMDNASLAKLICSYS